jgi:hypothetical protein
LLLFSQPIFDFRRGLELERTYDFHVSDNDLVQTLSMLSTDQKAYILILPGIVLYVVKFTLREEHRSI